jgi:hypothetical protein
MQVNAALMKLGTPAEKRRGHDLGLKFHSCAPHLAAARNAVLAADETD